MAKNGLTVRCPGFCWWVSSTRWLAGAMFLLYNLAHWSYWLSSAANYLLGGIVSFFLNKYFTFRKREWSWGQAVRFAVNVAACWLLAYGLAKPLLQLLAGRSLWLQENAAMLVGMCLYTALNYLGQRFFRLSEVTLHFPAKSGIIKQSGQFPDD